MRPFEERRREFLEYAAPPLRTGWLSCVNQLARLELGAPAVDEEPFRESLAFIDARRDCSDFHITALLRLLYRHRRSVLIRPELVEDIERCLLGFKYWWDEPGPGPMCWFTENHQILFHACELLAGQLWPDRLFPNSGMTGAEHAAKAARLVRRWLDWRERFGYSEWLSNCYFDEDLAALANLHDFAADADIRTRAAMQMDLLLFDMALHSHRGVFGCTHGRTYADRILGQRGDASATTSLLMFDRGLLNSPNNLGAMCLASSEYRLPPAIEAVVRRTPSQVLIRERHSLNVGDAPRYGLRYDSMEDILLFWSVQAFMDPRVIGTSMRVTRELGVGLDTPYEPYLERFERERRDRGQVLDTDVDRHSLTEVNIQTFRTPDYLLSCAQDYRAGRHGYQQHVWQATLGPDAVVFTNHPGSLDTQARPNFWAGNRVLPRAAQHRNVLVCIHRVPADDPFPFSHAWFPRRAFDEVVERSGWVFGRCGRAFVGLWSEHPVRWAEGPFAGSELRADAASNVWVCELGSAEQGEWPYFVLSLSGSGPVCRDGRVAFHSPTVGPVSFGWEDPLAVDGVEQPLRGYPRFDNPYCACPWDGRRVVIGREGRGLELDFDRGVRSQGALQDG